MRTLLTITILLTAVFCKGQKNYLVPLDSAYFEVIADSLVDFGAGLPDAYKFYPETYKTCPCIINDMHGVISYKSASFFRSSNKCLFLYTSNDEYFILTGQMTNKRDKTGEFIWKRAGFKVKTEIAEKYISMVRQEISKARVPEYDQLLIIMDGCSKTFGDLENNIYATTPRAFYSDSVDELIEKTEKFIER